MERRESDGEAEDDTCARSTATKAHAAVGAADGEGSVRGAQAFADHASLLAGMQLQQQLAQLAAAAYPAFQGVPASSVPRGFPTAEVVPARKAPPPEASLAPAMGVSAAMDPALVAGNSFVAALQAQLAVSHAASKVTTLWDPLQACKALWPMTLAPNNVSIGELCYGMRMDALPTLYKRARRDRARVIQPRLEELVTKKAGLGASSWRQCVHAHGASQPRQPPLP